MDVSYSMGEKEKIIAKKFFILLHLFLSRKYKNINVVFIRHHESAEECDEETFFTKKETGGTIVSTAYKTVKDIIEQRYPANDWNCYIAQASDGDNMSSDKIMCTQYLNKILPNIQLMAYIEIKRMSEDMLMYSLSTSDLWDVLVDMSNIYPQLSLEKINKEEDVLKVFRKFFIKGKK